MNKNIGAKDNNKKCNVITCIHYAGGLCVSFDMNDCEAFERHFIQEG